MIDLDVSWHEARVRLDAYYNNETENINAIALAEDLILMCAACEKTPAELCTLILQIAATFDVIEFKG